MTNAENTIWPFPTAGDGKDQQEGLTGPGDEAPPGTPGTGEQVCSRCGGSGVRDGGARCEACQGSGKVTVGIGGG
jgi:DnaJ-class molecular chaperone